MSDRELIPIFNREPGDILCICGDGFYHEAHECPWEDMRCEISEGLCNCCVQCQFICLSEPEEITDDEDYYEDDDDF